MLITVYDYGSIDGRISWGNIRYDDCTPTDLSDWTLKERNKFCKAIVKQVEAWEHRPQTKMEYEFYVKETWRQNMNDEKSYGQILFETLKKSYEEMRLDGAIINKWEDFDEIEQSTWENAAHEVIITFDGD